MPRTTQCPNCGVVLNLPDNAAGKKLKCPQCGTRFLADGTLAPRPDSKAPGSGASGAITSLTLSTRESEPEIPIAEGDLRETFAPDLLMGEEPGGGKPRGGEADAAELFREPAPRKAATTGAEARAKARRCPTCSSVVPAGMSLCAHCGLDLDTGVRHHFDEIFDEPVAAPRRSGPPLAISIIGGIVLMLSLLLALLGIVESQREGSQGWMILSLVFVGLFGLYAAVQFLRLKSIKLMILALLLGAGLNVGLLIAYPIVKAWQGPVVADHFDARPTVGDEMPRFTSREERLSAERWKINWGIVLLLADSGLILFLLTNRQIKAPFESRRPTSVPMA